MRSGVGAWAVVLTMVAAACSSTGDASEPADPPSTTAEHDDATDALVEARSEPQSERLAVDEPTTSTAATTSPPVPATDTPSADTLPLEADAEEVDRGNQVEGNDIDDIDGDIGDIDDGEVIDADEPVFDIGPPVELDVDLARFPVDDAGIGGTGGSEPGGDDPTVPDELLSGWAGFDQYLESVLIRPGNTAASVAVSIRGELVHEAAFGVRDPTSGDPAEPGDRFRIASISKPITAIVALQLVEDGVVGLDDPLGPLVAEHVGLGSVPVAAQGVTMRRLLNHTSGFGKYQTTFFRKGADDCVDAARQGLRRGAAGGGYVYSNMNYCVAGLAIEALTGLPYEDAVYRFLLTPLGISGMRLPPTFDPGPDEAQHRTTAGRNYMETLGAAGAWIASPTDLVTIIDSLDLSTPGFKPLELDTALSMFRPSGTTFGTRGYGLGVISYGDGRFGHTGTIESTHAMVLNRGDGVVWALTVAGDVPSESTDLERIVDEALPTGCLRP